MNELFDDATIEKWERLDPEYAEGLRKLNQMFKNENAEIINNLNRDNSKDQGDEMYLNRDDGKTSK